MRSGLKRVARGAINAAEAFRLARRVNRRSTLPIQVLYGGQCPTPGALVSGGAVKILDLAREFPEGGYSGHLLYLVTSALPRNAEAWVRVARKRGLRIVLNQNGVAYPAWTGLSEVERINRRNAWFISQADAVVFQSAFCQSAVERWVTPRLEFEGKSLILRNPVDLNRFSLTHGTRGKVLVLGSHHQPERVRLAIEAVAWLSRQDPHWSLEIAGPLRWEGAEQDFARWAKDSGLGPRLVRSGPYLRDQAPALVGSAQVVLHLQDKDASPTVPLEAQATGAAVVGIASGGMPELVSGIGGELLSVPQKWDRFYYPSVGEVASALSLTSCDSVARSERRARIASSFGVEAWVDHHRALFERILKT